MNWNCGSGDFITSNEEGGPYFVNIKHAEPSHVILSVCSEKEALPYNHFKLWHRSKHNFNSSVSKRLLTNLKQMNIQPGEKFSVTKTLLGDIMIRFTVTPKDGQPHVSFDPDNKRPETNFDEIFE
jgi:hypothetical protein